MIKTRKDCYSGSMTIEIAIIMSIIIIGILIFIRFNYEMYDNTVLQSIVYKNKLVYDSLDKNEKIELKDSLEEKMQNEISDQLCILKNISVKINNNNFYLSGECGNKEYKGLNLFDANFFRMVKVIMEYI